MRSDKRLGYAFAISLLVNTACVAMVGTAALRRPSPCGGTTRPRSTPRRCKWRTRARRGPARMGRWAGGATGAQDRKGGSAPATAQRRARARVAQGGVTENPGRRPATAPPTKAEESGRGPPLRRAPAGNGEWRRQAQSSKKTPLAVKKRGKRIPHGGRRSWRLNACPLCPMPLSIRLTRPGAPQRGRTGPTRGGRAGRLARGWLSSAGLRFPAGTDAPETPATRSRRRW